MNKLRTILCLVLALLIAMSSVSAFAAVLVTEEFIDDIFRFDVGEFLISDKELEADSGNELIYFLESIGLWDDASIPKDNLLTMTELAVIMSKVRLGSENAVKDVYGKNADNTKADYKTVYECLLTATGHYHKCAEFGGNDEALLIVAANIGLLSEKPANIKSFVTRGELAKLLTKAVTIDICSVEYTSTGGIRYVEKPGENILSTIHGIYDVSGFVNAIPGLAVYGSTHLRDGYIQIGRTDIKAPALIASDYFAAQVDAYARYDDVLKEYNLIYIAPSQKNPYFEIDFKDIADIDRESITYYDENGEEFEVSVSGFTAITENGKELESLSQMSDYKTNEGKIRLVSSEKKGDYNMAVIYKYDYYITDYVDVNQGWIGIRFGMQHKGNPYVKVDIKAVNNVLIDNVPADYSVLPLNTAIRVFESYDGEYLEIIASDDKVVEGEITSLYDDIIEAKNEKFRASKNMLARIEECKNSLVPSYSDVKAPQLGDKVKLYVYDDIVAGYASSGGYVYAYLKDAKETRTSIDPDLILRVITEDNIWLDLTLSEKLTLDGVAGKTKAAVSDFIRQNKDIVLGELVRIKIINDTEISALDTVYESSAERETLDDIVHVSEYEKGRFDAKPGYHKWVIENERYLLDKTSPVFVVPEKLEREEEYRVINPTGLAYNVTYDITGYSPNEFLHLGAVVVHGGLNAVVADNKLSWLYIESMREYIIDPETYEFGYKVIGKLFREMATPGVGVVQDAEYFISQEAYKEALDEGNAFVVGDFMRFSMIKNEIISWTFEDGIDRGTATITKAPGVYELGAINGVNDHTAFVGHVKKVDVANTLILVDCGDGGMRVLKPRSKGVIDTAGKKATETTMADYHEGDLVYMIGTGAHCSFIIKNSPQL